jgi:3-methylcrotonyl-CoA carboxylase alpha subunit
VRIDTGVRSGDRITHFYDPMIAKVIVADVNRDSAVDRMAATLRPIAIEGVETNLAFLQRVLAHPAFRAGEVRTAFIERHKAALLSS